MIVDEYGNKLKGNNFQYNRVAMAVIVTFTSTCNTNLKQFRHHGYIVLFESRMFAVFFVEAIID